MILPGSSPALWSRPPAVISNSAVAPSPSPAIFFARYSLTTWSAFRNSVNLRFHIGSLRCPPLHSPAGARCHWWRYLRLRRSCCRYPLHPRSAPSGASSLSPHRSSETPAWCTYWGGSCRILLPCLRSSLRPVCAGKCGCDLFFTGVRRQDRLRGRLSLPFGSFPFPPPASGDPLPFSPPGAACRSPR